MALIFGHDRLDLGQFPDLMPQRFLVVARELCAATSAFVRFQPFHVVAFITGNQRSLMLFMAWLSAAFLLGFSFRQLRFGVRMPAAGRQGGVLRRFSPTLQPFDPRFQFGDLGQQQPDDGLCLRRLPRNDFFRDFQRHALGVAEISIPVQVNLHENCSQGVNGYASTTAGSISLS